MQDEHHERTERIRRTWSSADRARWAESLANLESGRTRLGRITLEGVVDETDAHACHLRKLLATRDRT